MSHSFLFAKKSFRGFTLIELLVVIAIIGLLGTIIAGPINNARNKGKDAKKVADIKNIQAALTQYADTNGQFPSDITVLVPNYIDALPSNVATTAATADKYLYIVYDTDATAATNYTAYHLATKLLVTGNPALDTDADCGAGCGFSGVSSTLVDNAGGTPTADPGAPANATTDIAAVADTSATVCVTGTANSCVYDVRGSL
jgi:prepilin-type N-terminal cleavage/methylation domain-containing protein